MGAGERGVAAELDLEAGREPAQFEIRLAGRVRDGESGLGEIVLRGDRLENLVRQPVVERHDGRRIAGEGPVREGVDLDEGQHLHSLSPMVSSRSASGLSGSSTWPSGSTWMMIPTPGNSFSSSASISSTTSCASTTDIAGSSQMWNWAKWSAPLVRVRRS